tara:strand:- start:267 stop:500 length:234 start_codon:yes stop_codon:yes gene_type:complete
MITNYIDFRIFLVSLALGIFFVYIFDKKKTVVYVYPTPNNENKIFFKDKLNNCFKFKSQNIDCPSDKSKILDIPAQY